MESLYFQFLITCIIRISRVSTRNKKLNEYYWPNVKGLYLKNLAKLQCSQSSVQCVQLASQKYYYSYLLSFTQETNKQNKRTFILYFQCLYSRNLQLPDLSIASVFTSLCPVQGALFFCRTSEIESEFEQRLVLPRLPDIQGARERRQHEDE